MTSLANCMSVANAVFRYRHGPPAWAKAKGVTLNIVREGERFFVNVHGPELGCAARYGSVRIDRESIESVVVEWDEGKTVDGLLVLIDRAIELALRRAGYRPPPAPVLVKWRKAQLDRAVWKRRTGR